MIHLKMRSFIQMFLLTFILVQVHCQGTYGNLNYGEQLKNSESPIIFKDTTEKTAQENIDEQRRKLQATSSNNQQNFPDHQRGGEKPYGQGFQQGGQGFQQSSQGFQQSSQGSQPIGPGFQQGFPQGGQGFQQGFQQGGQGFQQGPVYVQSPSKERVPTFPSQNPLSQNGPSSGQTQQQYSPSPSSDLQIEQALTKFSLNMFKSSVLRNQGQNVVVSPLSMATILSYLQQVSTGLTQDEISNALGQSPANSKKSYSNLVNNIRTKSTEKNNLWTANAMFVNNKLRINNNAKKTAVDSYKAIVEPVDFNDPTSAANRINDWVQKHTYGVINELISPSKIDRNTQSMLLNAIYFKGVWQKMFETKRTKLMDFSPRPHQKVQKEFMLHNERFDVGDEDNIGARWISLPYDGNKYAMVFVLPQQSFTLDELIQNMSEYDLNTIMNTGEDYKCAIAITKFNVTFDTPMTNTLQDLGIKQAFTTNSEIDVSNSNRKMSITSANQRSTLSIDESGTVAASASSIGVNTLSLPAPNEIFVFRLTQPFLAILVDKELRIPIMIAKIQEP